ncbi:MAG: hypothetical protein JWQ74_323 [Marmoricola sp.]|nr:hypothetical protein [Marmoricola sp.]
MSTIEALPVQRPNRLGVARRFALRAERVAAQARLALARAL